MQEVYFLARHVPFWGVPLIILGTEFAYLFWLKQKKTSVVLCLMIALMGFLATGFYVWAGGPEKTVKIIKKMHRNHLN
jgi:nicotinamide riboside transporter PnuC